MRVIVISAAFPPLRAGESDYVLWLCERLAECRYDVELVTTDCGLMPVPAGVAVTPLMRGWGWSELPRLLWHLRQRSPDVVLMPCLGWLFRRSPMAGFLPSAIRRVLPKTRLHTLFFDIAGATDAVIRDSDAILVLSEANAESLRQRRPDAAERIHVLSTSPLVPTAVDARAARIAGRSLAGIDDNHFLFVNFGYIYPGKGIDTLLQAFARVAAEQPLARLALVGGLPDEKISGWATYGECLKHLAWALRIEDKVRWIGGFEAKSDLPSQCLFAGDAAALPFDGGIGLSHTSAAAIAWHGLPLLATAGDRIEPAFIAGENALLSAPRDVEGLTRSMRSVMGDPSLAGKLSAGALDLARRWFSPERVMERLGGILTHRGGIR